MKEIQVNSKAMNSTLNGVEMAIEQLKRDFENFNDRKTRSLLNNLDVKMAVLEKTLDGKLVKLGVLDH